jgi:hypothetical protein
MGLRYGGYECAQCGVVLDLLPNEEPVVVLSTGSGRPVTNSLQLYGRVIHRCELDLDFSDCVSGVAAPTGCEAARERYR